MRTVIQKIYAYIYRATSEILFRGPSALLLITVFLSSAIGCGWSFLTEHSVRFSGYGESDFTRLPALPINPALQTKVGKPRDPDALYEAADQLKQELDSLWERAGKAESEENYKLTADLLRSYLERSSAGCDGGWFNTEEVQSYRNSARDRLDALQSFSPGVKPPSLTAYLAARRKFDRRLESSGDIALAGENEAIRKELGEIKAPAALADNVAYLQAATLYCEGMYEKAEAAFHAMLQKYPRSEKREAAYLMAQRAAIQEYKEALQSSDNEIDQRRKKKRESAMRLYHDGLREFPRGKFTTDLRGWAAHMYLLNADYAMAMAEYYRSLSEAANPLDRQSLLVSLRLTRHKITDEDLRKMEEDLIDEPAAARTYAYHVLYNYLPDVEFYQIYDLDEDASEEDDATRAVEMEKVDRREKEHIVTFIHRLLRRHPGGAMSGGFLLRLSQAQLELNDAASARASAVRALGLGLKGRDRLEALWIEGASEFRLRQHATARKTLQQLISEFPDSDLAEGADRMIAMAAEDAGDLEGALDQYIRLGYEDDIAYFVDVLLTPEQLAGFIARHPDSAKINEYRYTLAVRYLRLHRWKEARGALAKVMATEQGFPSRFYGYSEDSDPVEFRTERRTAKMPSDNSGIAARWIWRDLKTIDDMERMEREVAAATDDEAKAEALYQMASYFYQGSSLLFYNPAFWDGSRHYKLDEVETSNGFRAPGEAQTFQAHMREHEPVVHALDIYLEILSRFPKTRAARDAMYTAAVCHERLSDYNAYWRNVYGCGMHAGARMIAYRDVRQAYPSYRIPRGTIGWEPATRTVNGGPGWEQAPRPQSQPRRRDVVRSSVQAALAAWREKSGEAANSIETTVNGIIKGLIYSLLAVIVLGACYFASLGLYLRNQQSPPITLALAAPPDSPKNYPDNPVEKLINDESSDRPSPLTDAYRRNSGTAPSHNP